MAPLDKLTIDNIRSGEIPPEILNQLKILNRVTFPLKPTQPSAVSSTGEQPPLPPPGYGAPDAAKQLDKLIDHVVDMENLVENLEDAANELLKDIDIPFPDDRTKEAALRLNPDATSIDKDVIDRAISIIDIIPLFALGQDPVLAALTGDGSIDGPWMDCSEMTSAMAELLKIKSKNAYEAEKPVRDQAVRVADDHDKRMMAMMLETLLMLWWNMIWCKFIVDLAIINPTRTLVANPVDGIAGFFMKKRFTKKSTDWLKANGPINKLLNGLRNILICLLPPKVYPRYKPMVEIDCSKVEDNNCPPVTEGPTITPSNDSGSVRQMGEFIDAGGAGNCTDINAFLEEVDNTLPDGPGASPDCFKAAKIVLDAVIADALTAPNPARQYMGLNAGTKFFKEESNAL